MGLAIRLLGLDPGLRNTGWGVIEILGNRLVHVANGTLHSTPSLSIAERLVQLHDGVNGILERYDPQEAAVEETFVNKNLESTLKLGLARGAILIAPAKQGLAVTEYAPNRVKKSVVGVGHANKEQVQTMVERLLPDCEITGPDAADALAVAICHAHFVQGRGAFGQDVGVSRRTVQAAPMSGYERAVAAALAKEANS